MATVDVRVRPRLGLLQVGVSLGALAGIGWWASRQQAPSVSLGGRTVGELFAALGLYAVATTLRAERWHRILARSRLDRGRGESYRLTLVGYMGNNALPARAGDLMRVVLLGGPRRAVLGTVVAERLLDVCALATVFAIVVVDRGLDFGPLPYMLAAAAVAAVAVSIFARLRGLERARDWIRPVAGATRDLLGAHGAALLAMSLALWLTEALVYLVVGAAVGVQLGVAGALYVMALTNLSALIPAAPGYIGTYDAAVLLALRSLHLPALGYLLVLRFVLFVPITVAGFAVFLGRYVRRRA
ncbi:MAG: lysylphosphatidylglycerol synthase transmembrane domain-containing protein [Gaiellaceae bacterium]